MKLKILFFATLILIFNSIYSFAADGEIEEVEEIAMTTAYVEIATTDIRPGQQFIFKTRNQGRWFIKKTSTSTKYAIIEGADTFRIYYKQTKQNITHFWAALESGTDTLEVLILNK